eukprot:CAMPEP_0174699006 /NCGR_PEP_ID=MMETSP1094-20130205/4424_1 /TAXON_ID=156173 /ORGANISM="Chrysochromulina brevifilum, Strain UTEX LB 985" /LENGTH=40 /DNA_ID= /DNA_START= /DNA_END= /DNA_ORIENTATION=
MPSIHVCDEDVDEDKDGDRDEDGDGHEDILPQVLYTLWLP